MKNLQLSMYRLSSFVLTGPITVFIFLMSLSVSAQVCTGQINIFPHNENFEGDLGLWVQDTNDSFDWILQSGATPNSGTGPTTAAEGDYFLYTDSGPNSPWGVASVISPCIDFTNHGGGKFYFSYHINGSHAGWLELMASTNNGASWKKIWGAGGEGYGNEWIRQHVELPDYAGKTVRFKFIATMNSAPGGEIAIDDIGITSFAKYQAPALSNENYVLTRTYQREMASPTAINAVRDVMEEVTYFDGLGRPKQQVAIKASPDKKDIVTHMAYDDFGRMDKGWLPYPASSGGSGSYRSTGVENSIKAYYYNTYAEDFPGLPNFENANPYSEKRFEASPLNRVLQQAAPGASWALGSWHEIEFGYAANTAADNVRLFEVSFQGGNPEDPALEIASNGYYGPGQLYKSIVRDENHTGTGKDHTTETFKDKQGRVVLKRTYNNEIPHDTYYVYDAYGNLTYVLPPKMEGSSAALSQITASLDDLGYQYKYDHRNRVVEKKIPGKGWEYIIYNSLDQPIMTQDGNQRAKSTKEWLFTKYDAFGRITYTGKVNDQRGRLEIQAEADNYNGQLWVDRAALSTLAGTSIYYTNNGYPNTPITEILTITYYDDYDFPQLLGGNSLDTVSWGVPVSRKVKGLPTFMQSRVLGTDYFVETAIQYDKKGREFWRRTNNEYLETINFVAHKLDFAGKITDTYTWHRTYNEDPIIYIDHFDYDHMGRLLNQYRMLKDYGYPVEAIVEFKYDELGQLVGKGVGNRTGRERLQNINYAYNVRGWLKQINDPNNLGTDLFSFNIRYNDPTTGGTPLYNGNISQTRWRTNNDDNSLKTYTYSYDALNRITKGIFNVNTYSLMGVTYDKNGNITSLQRNKYNGNDNFGYTYSGNQLMSLTGTDPGNYSYDYNGNMITDSRKNITGIDYNHLNLPINIAINGGNIQYIYDATGIKQRKIVNENGNITKTDYAGNFIYKNGILQFFNHSEGYAEPDGNGGFHYIYNYKDHLGSIRLTYCDIDDNGSIDPNVEILSENNYYPGGLLHKGYNNIISSGANSSAEKYKYQGQELEEELGKDTYAYQWRDYDPALMRFNKIDRFAEKYERLSPYQFSANNPIYFREIAGDSLNLAQLFKKDDKGNYINVRAVEAFQYFASTKEGKSYLSQFASEGQFIEGTDIIFGSDGKYHTEGIDLAYNTEPLSASDGRNADTGADQNNNGRFTINVSLAAAGSKYQNVEDIVHETFIHVDAYARDILDNNVLDFSNMSNFVNERNRERRRHHIQAKIDQRQNGSLFGTKGFNLLLKANQKYYGNKTRNQVWNTMWNYAD